PTAAAPSVRRSSDRGSLGHPIRPDVHSRAIGGTQMTKGPRLALTFLLIALAALGLVAGPAAAQGQTIKIGLLFDHTGPFSAAGSLNCWRGAKMMIDLINEKGGILGKYKIVQVRSEERRVGKECR